MTQQAKPPEHPDPKTSLLLQRLAAADYDSLIARPKIVTLNFRRRGDSRPVKLYS